MSTPETILDHRFSDPAADATNWDDTRRALEAAELFWICTVRADGRPHVTPLVAVWLDDALHFCTGETEQKCLNLRANQHVTLTTGRNTWDDGLDIVVEGDAVPVTDRKTLERLAEVWAGKWDGSWQYTVVEGGFRAPGDDGTGPATALVFAVAPRRVLAFAKGVFSHTSHRF